MIGARHLWRRRAGLAAMVAGGAIGAVWLCGLAGCSATGGAQDSGAAAAGQADRPPLFEGMGKHTRKVTTSSAEAQKYFNQALVWTFAFNHDEAIRSYKEAARLDPECAMAWWGVALCNGPHINNAAMDEAHSTAAWEALGKARALRGKASPTEQELIDALGTRYAWPIPEDRGPLDRAYAAAMNKVWRNHPDDADIGTLYAESMMDLHPWDLWTKGGEPKEGAEEIVATLERVLAIAPNHPGACHLYIHAVEASNRPERAVAAANRLRNMVPGSGHLVHMPAHIDVRVGDWAAAAECNERAMKVDERYRKISPRQGFYRVYMAHNPHFLAWTQMMEARPGPALAAARAMIAGVPAEVIREQSAMIDPYMSIEFDVLKRFGMWEKILAAPAPPTELVITTALWRFNRGLALAALGRVAEAQREQAWFRGAVGRIPDEAMMAINPAHRVMEIADHVLSGEIAFQRGSIDEAVSHLRAAAVIEDDLLYMEPPEWIQPVRHTLGAVLVSAGRYEEAEKEYRADLRYWPKNGWALLGLKQCQEARGDAAGAKATDAMLKQAWRRAQIKPATTCLCVEGK